MMEPRYPLFVMLGMMVATAAAFALLYAYALHSVVRIEFFEVSAQVIPVLLLAIVVERRIFENTYTGEQTDRDIRVVFIFLFTVAEALALWVVASGRVSGTMFVGSATGIAWGLILVYASVQSRRSRGRSSWATLQGAKRVEMMAQWKDSDEA